MPLPVPANNTCDVYRNANAPPAGPDVAGVRCYLHADYGRRLETGEGEVNSLRYTHTLMVDVAADIRDGFSVFGSTGTEDSVYIPDQNGTRFFVVFVERRGRGLPTDYKKVYLDRYAPTRPTNNL